MPFSTMYSMTARTGVELTRVGSQNDPVEGDNVVLLCRAYLFPSPPKWTYFNSQTGQMEPVDEPNNIPEGKKNCKLLKRRKCSSCFSNRCSYRSGNSREHWREFAGI